MTGRTHDLAAFTALNIAVATSPLAPITLPTALVALGANMLGGIAPDIDQPTSKIWNSFAGGGIVGRLLTPLLGGHRFISHSILGILLFGSLMDFILNKLATFLIVDMSIVWWAFMIGFVSHLVMDTFTREGVPWLFPIPIRWGIPPFRFTRIKTGGMVEKGFVFPALLLLNGYVFYTHYHGYISLLKNYIK